MSDTLDCRICGGTLHEFFDFGRQPLADAFVDPNHPAQEYFHRLAVAQCGSCTMVQLLEDVPREHMFRTDYPYLSSGSSAMQDHFRATAGHFLDHELRDLDSFVVEFGSNDGIMLDTVARAGRRHLGVEPCAGVAEAAAAKGIRVRNAFFEESTAAEIVATEGRANVIYAANTFSHISYVDSVFRGVDILLDEDGIFVFEDPYMGDIVERTSFDQIYDEHFYFFTVRSVQNMAAFYGFELVDVEHLPVHGGEIRYTLARSGSRTPSPEVARFLDREKILGLAERPTLESFATNIDLLREGLRSLLVRCRDEGRSVVGYGATAKSATLTNYCGIGPELVSFIADNTPAKQGTLSPGSHIPVRSPEAFADPYPDYALLFAWNHAEEIMRKEAEFKRRGGRWILYVPELHIV
ncbi:MULTISPECIES: class I SAM-dependent methyltransferase [Streptomyces]|uniref:NDP-C-methyltransferase n=1 Tax=Streptomyces griseus subsp. griseus TaxID=67263 RepID=Q70J72_STRGR|nr:MULTISPECIES: class I SAM-dependent methyltransferase [Streptomyces]MXG26077.1 methyltransferase domain-containing protein [Streptomyces sp. YIM 132580]PVC64139.1 SAM-dependent methyltransferase [Streptomyces sp. CS065A]CAE17543.1 NDP-C-methyltransferase [Streptomyces griseus subsp. griseus]